MVSLRQFRIVFNNEDATYEPGDVVGGKIIVETTKDKYTKGLYFIVNGTAFVHWLEHDVRNESRSHSFASTQEYFSFKQEILSERSSKAGHTIPYGINEFTFSFRLPHKIPCSFENRVGYVRYTIKAVIDRPWKFNHECKAAFSVVSRLNLNLYREKCLAIRDEMNKNFNCLCWIAQGSMSIQILVPCSGYVPGQVITITIHYTSTPNIPITKLSTKLLRTVHFHTPNSTLIHTNVLKKNKHMPPFPLNGHIVSELLIPPIPPSNLYHCDVIDLEYELVVSLHVSSPYCKIKRIYPLLIGTVPLYRPALTFLHGVVSRSTMSCMARPPMIPYPPSMLGQSTESNISIQNRNISTIHMDIPPPCYEEGSSSTPHIKDMHETDYVFGVNNSFSPKYPVYNYPAPRLPNESL